MSNKGSSIYDILVFSFADTQTADEMVKELKASQKLGGYKVVAEAVVIREADGSVKVHEPGKGGRDATIGAIAGGALGLLVGPVGVLWLAAAGGQDDWKTTTKGCPPEGEASHGPARSRTR